MAARLDEAKAELVDKAAAAIRRSRTGRDEDQAARLEAFLRLYYRGVAPDDLLGRDPLDLYGAALSHWQLAHHRTAKTPNIRVYTPNFDEHLWQSSHSVVEIVTDDMPFLVDSVTMELNRHGYGIHLVVHPVGYVERDDDDRLVEVRPVDESCPAEPRESFMHVEFDRQSEPEVLAELRDDLHRVLADVRAAYDDWEEMRARARELAGALECEPCPVPADERAEAQALLRWMAEDHFTFLGYREYELCCEEGADALRAVPGSGLGILREERGRGGSRSFDKLPPEVRRKAREPQLLNLTKANAYATVHRPTHLDYVGVKRFDEQGRVIGERRFLGLYSSTAYNARPRDIPVLRRKVRAVLDRAGFDPASHDGKDLVQALEVYPRDELFQITEDDLYTIAMGILHLQERRRVRLFLRRDAFGRYYSCLTYLPRERYTTEIRLRMQEILRRAFGGTGVEWSTRLSESVLARLHFLVYTEPGDETDHDVADIERRLAEAVRSWPDDLQDALVERYGEERGLELSRRYRDAFPAAYREDFVARSAVGDIDRLERLRSDQDLAMSLYRPIEVDEKFLRFKLHRTGASISLSHVLPMLQNMGVTVVDERPYAVERAGEPIAWVYDFGLRHAGDLVPDIAEGQLREWFSDTFARVWRGEVESDGFNRLVLQAGLIWPDVVVLRAYCKYLRQIGTRFSQTYMEDTLSAHPAIARLLIELFHARFDPQREHRRESTAEGLAAQIETALDDVASLDEDRILRSYLRLVQATLRTNFFQPGPAGTVAGDPARRPYLSVKLDSARVPDLPLPRPLYEIFVYSPRMEGVHLRAGQVARGGLRWSDRREDFRTEILGLMKAQTVKNVVIVPVGAKGGFVVKRPPTGAGRDALMAEVVACYGTLIRGLLDLTDNLEGGRVVPPPQVVRYDGDDPYLVVAADKGTATFSDIANGIAAEYGFWLGDAFASGGSSGYDHKRMGITARGAWESVSRSFRELGINVATTDFTVAGIGDMSGDVFGNGMLLSRHIKLVAAFDHRHVFVDPDPDPEASWQERRRLFELPRSSWDDYDRARLSAGGGIYPRTAKSIPVSPQMRQALGIEADRLTPNELITAVLRAPVDLLWNGGIGTYVKARAETNADVGDKSNDAVRVNAAELRCSVVGEGGNLGFTQRGRVEYALRGGRIHTDAIDNSAGVDTSDHEVNIKILLDQLVRDGDLTEKQRNELLRDMTEEVAGLVLRHNYRQVQALANSQGQAAAMLHVHARWIEALARRGVLDRELEFLPAAGALAERRAAKRGLTVPELAVLLAYTKIVVAEELLASDLPEDPYLVGELERYFPTALRERYAEPMRGHRLRREIVATTVANSLVNRAGISFVYRLGEETAAPVSEIARAYTVARDVFGMHPFWAAVETLDNVVPAEVQTRMLITARTLVERATRWLLRNRRPPLDLAGTVTAFGPRVAELLTRLPELLVGGDRGAVETATGQYVAAGVPAAVAARAAALGAGFATLDIVDCAAAGGHPLETVAGVYFCLGARLQLDWLRDKIDALPREDRWQTLARAALRDDLYAAHRALTSAVLENGGDEPMAAQRVDRWLAQNTAAAERCRQLVSDVKAGGGSELAMLSVVLRAIRNVTAPGWAPG